MRFIQSIIVVVLVLFGSVLYGQSILIKAGKVYTMTGDPISPCQVLIEAGKIKAVGTSISAPSGATVQDLGPDSVLLPGFVNAYTQAGLVSDGSDEVSKEITPDFTTVNAIDWRSLDIKKRLSYGTTTMCVCPGTENVIAGIAAIIKTDKENKSATGGIVNADGPLVANLSADPARRNRARQRPDSIYVRQPTNRMGVMWLLRNNLNKAKRDNGDPSLNHVREVLASQRMMFMVSRKAHDLSSVMTLMDEFNFSPILVGAHEAHLIADTLAERNLPVVLGASTTGSMRGPEDSKLCWNQAGVLSAAGVDISISGENLLKQARFAHRFGLDEQSALATITRSPAKMLGIENRVGTIAQGMDADLVALDGQPLEFTTPIRWVMVNGKINELNKEK